ncbi:MAG: YdcF family protein [Bryobacteraceae bacterium]
MNPLVLHKSLPVLFLPLGASLMMLVAALRWRRRVLIALPLAILWLLSTPVVADPVMRTLEDRYAWRPNSAYPEADAVFALGGGILGPRDGLGTEVEWGASAERFDRALSLYTSGRARVLVISAGQLFDSDGFCEGVRLREIAIQRGVPPESVIVTRETLNTADEAGALTQLVARLHWRRILLVTSAFHMPRAMRLFRECPAEIVPVPVNYLTPDPRMALEMDQYLPQAEALFRSERALREYLGILYYSVVRHEPRASRQTR